MKMSALLGGGGNTNDIPLRIGFQVKSYFTIPNSKYRILDSRIIDRTEFHIMNTIKINETTFFTTIY
jgi:hypothetical protein